MGSLFKCMRHMSTQCSIIHLWLCSSTCEQRKKEAHTNCPSTEGHWSRTETKDLSRVVDLPWQGAGCSLLRTTAASTGTLSGYMREDSNSLGTICNPLPPATCSQNQSQGRSASSTRKDTPPQRRNNRCQLTKHYSKYCY